MKMQLHRIFLLAFMLFFWLLQMAFAQKPLDSFEKISLGGIGDVRLEKGNENSILFEKLENLSEDDFVVEVEDHILKIRLKEDKNYNNKDRKAQICVTYSGTLNSISLSGAGNIKSKQTLEANELDLKLSGAGNITLDLNVDKLTTSLNGAGNFYLSGKTDTQVLKISGAGNIEAFDLVSQDCLASVSGVGNLEVNAHRSLDATANGVGNIYYKGNPQVLNNQAKGMGNIKKVE